MPVALQDELDRCVACGFCLPACPTYALSDDEVRSPRGRIALMRQLTAGTLEPTAQALDTYDSCLGCRACETACPSGVHYEEIFLAGRAMLHAQGRVALRERLLLWWLRSPRRLSAARALWRALGGALSAAARGLGAKRGALALMAVLPTSGRSPQRSEGAEVWLHEGCIMAVAFSQTNARAQDLVQECGHGCGGSGPLCCGALHAHGGDGQAARALARKVIEAYDQSGAGIVLSTAGGCGAFMRSYDALLADDATYRERAARFAHAVRDATEWLAEQDLSLQASATRIAYQDSCHLRHGQKVHAQPRALLQRIGQVTEMDGADRCCGSAGIYNLSRPQEAESILDGKMQTLRRSGVQVLAAANPGCELQLRHGVRRHGLPVRVAHVVDLLYEARQPQ